MSIYNFFEVVFLFLLIIWLSFSREVFNFLNKKNRRTIVHLVLGILLILALLFYEIYYIIVEFSSLTYISDRIIVSIIVGCALLVFPAFILITGPLPDFTELKLKKNKNQKKPNK